LCNATSRFACFDRDLAHWNSAAHAFILRRGSKRGLFGGMTTSIEPSRPVTAFGYRPVLHGVGLALSLALLWLLLSGHYVPLLLVLGALSVALCVLIVLRMDLIDHEGVPIHLTPSALRYWPWLLVEIVKSNIDVAWRVVSPGLDISPTLFETRCSQHSDLGQVIYANSITLTPGTVSADLDSGVIVVHALTEAGATAVLGGEMDRRVTELERLS